MYDSIHMLSSISAIVANSRLVSSKSSLSNVKLSCKSIDSFVLLGASVAAITADLALASFGVNAPKLLGLLALTHANLYK